MYNSQNKDILQSFYNYVTGRITKYTFSVNSLYQILDNIRYDLVMETLDYSKVFSKRKVSKDFVLKVLSDTQSLLMGNNVSMNYKGSSYLNAIKSAIEYADLKANSGQTVKLIESNK